MLVLFWGWGLYFPTESRYCILFRHRRDVLGSDTKLYIRLLHGVYPPLDFRDLPPVCYADPGEPFEAPVRSRTDETDL